MHSNTEIISLLDDTIIRLFAYCRKKNWAGYDPYDALNSKIFQSLTFLHSKYPRLILTQFMKRSPINFRPLLRVPKGHNPKGIALFCSSLIRLHDVNFLSSDKAIFELLDKLIKLRNPDQSYYCWGYNFDWQSRQILLPKNHPNIIATTFAGNALLDAYEKYCHPQYLNMALSASEFILHGLNITKNNGDLCFSYTPLDFAQIHNANLLGAAFLARIYYNTGETKFLNYSIKAANYSTSKQNKDGSWFYGEYDFQKWIDNFHTGYNLVALKKISHYCNTDEFVLILKKGLQFYLDNFFFKDEIPKYFHHKLFPIDIHSIAYSIVTLVEFSDLNEKLLCLAKKIFKWSTTNFQNKTDYFYYQKNRWLTNRIPYMRWSQAWMLYAIVLLYEQINLTERKYATDFSLEKNGSIRRN